MKTQSVWLSYDLGVKGDYPGLYSYLDSYDAKECGNSVAYFKFKYKVNLTLELEKELKDNIEFNKGDRIYVIFKRKEKEGNYTTVGRFIIGNRKSKPWEGYAPSDENILDT